MERKRIQVQLSGIGGVYFNVVINKDGEVMEKRFKVTELHDGTTPSVLVDEKRINFYIQEG